MFNFTLASSHSSQALQSCTNRTGPTVLFRLVRHKTGSPWNHPNTRSSQLVPGSVFTAKTVTVWRWHLLKSTWWTESVQCLLFWMHKPPVAAKASYYPFSFINRTTIYIHLVFKFWWMILKVGNKHFFPVKYGPHKRCLSSPQSQTLRPAHPHNSLINFCDSPIKTTWGFRFRI